MPDQNLVVVQLFDINKISIPHSAWENTLFRTKFSSCK